MRSILLSDLSHVTAGGLTSEFLPYGVGCIKSYFLKYAKSRDSYDDIRIFQDPQSFISSYLSSSPEVVAFSNYSWNRDLSYGLAAEVKRRSPSTLVVFGGPNYPLEDPLREDWFRKFPAIDVYVTGEGEEPFAALIDLWTELRDVEAVKRAGVEGCHSFVDGKLF